MKYFITSRLTPVPIEGSSLPVTETSWESWSGLTGLAAPDQTEFVWSFPSLWPLCWRPTSAASGLRGEGMKGKKSNLLARASVQRLQGWKFAPAVDGQTRSVIILLQLVHFCSIVTQFFTTQTRLQMLTYILSHLESFTHCDQESAVTPAVYWSLSTIYWTGTRFFHRSAALHFHLHTFSMCWAIPRTDFKVMIVHFQLLALNWIWRPISFP